MPATSTCVRSVSASRLTKEAAPQQLIVIFSVTRRSEEHTSELQSQSNLVCRLLLEKKKHVHDVHVTVPGWVARQTAHRQRRRAQPRAPVGLGDAPCVLHDGPLQLAVDPRLLPNPPP